MRFSPTTTVLRCMVGWTQVSRNPFLPACVAAVKSRMLRRYMAESGIRPAGRPRMEHVRAWYIKEGRQIECEIERELPCHT
jgi:hypothetical protein